MKIRAINFQAIADAQIEAKGLTVITGPSNRGKSALLRAAASALFGSLGDHTIRHDADFSAVALVHDDLKVIVKKVPAAKRKPNLQPSLTINGVENTKIGRDHLTLTEPFGILDIKTTNGSLRPQYADQHHAIFLIGETPSTAAEVLKMVGRAEVIAKATDAARSDKQEYVRTHKQRTEDEGKAKAEVDLLAPILDIKAQWEATAPDREKVKQNLTRIERVRKMGAKLATLHERKIPSPLPIPAFKDTKRLRRYQALTPRQIPYPIQTITLKSTVKLKKYRDLCALTAKMNEDLAHMKVDLDKLKEEHTSILHEMGTCPVCNQSTKDL